MTNRFRDANRISISNALPIARRCGRKNLQIHWLARALPVIIDSMNLTSIWIAE
jgi:hypothetical protein